MDRNKVVLGYEDLNNDLEVEIVGIKFNIGITEEKLREINALNYKFKGKSEEEKAKLVINTILGENAYIDIKSKYKKDTGKEMEIIMWTKIMMFIYRAIKGYKDQFGNEINEITQFNNRRQRRENRFNNRRQNYRRY